MSTLKLKSNEYYKTSDLCCASTLCTLGFTLESIERTSLSKATFVFKNSPKLHQKLEEFFKGHLAVEPKLFFSNLKFIKTRLYER